MLHRYYLIVFFVTCVWGMVFIPMGDHHENLQGSTPVYTYRVIHTYPHDPTAFTQGLVFDEAETLIEGTGLYGQSTLRRVDLQTGTILECYELPENFFGEGITLYGNKIFQLTYKENTGFIYDRQTLKVLSQFSYPTEGWGITCDETHLIMSDGSATLYLLDPHSFERVGTLPVHDENGPVIFMNELEYVEGEIYANIWLTNRIARICPQTGEVLGWIDLEGLLPDSLIQVADVLNGIAYDAKTNRLFVTGKFWPYLFEIEVVPKGSPLVTPPQPYPQTLMELIM